MKLMTLLVSLLIAAQASADRSIEITPLQLQFRYEDSANQAIEIVDYRSYGLAARHGLYRVGIEYSRREIQTGNSSFSVRSDIKEYAVTAGYQIYRISAPKEKSSLEFLIGGTLGTTQTDVLTQVFGSPSISKSGTSAVYGVAAAIVGRVKYFFIEAELKFLNSKNFSPQWVPTAQLKLGVGIPY